MTGKEKAGLDEGSGLRCDKVSVSTVGSSGGQNAL